MMKTRRCAICDGRMVQRHGVAEGMPYRYWHCLKCGDDILTMAQVEKAVRNKRRIQYMTVNRWGPAVGIRIPARIARQYSLKHGTKVGFLEEKDGLRLVK